MLDNYHVLERKVPLVEVTNVLTEEEAFGVKALAGSVRRYDLRGKLSGVGRQQFRIYLSFYLQKFLPNVASQLYMLR